jgi:hypothetical protein
MGTMGTWSLDSFSGLTVRGRIHDAILYDEIPNEKLDELVDVMRAISGVMTEKMGVPADVFWPSTQPAQPNMMNCERFIELV